MGLEFTDFSDLEVELLLLLSLVNTGSCLCLCTGTDLVLLIESCVELEATEMSDFVSRDCFDAARGAIIPLLAAFLMLPLLLFCTAPAFSSSFSSCTINTFVLLVYIHRL